MDTGPLDGFHQLKADTGDSAQSERIENRLRGKDRPVIADCDGTVRIVWR
jgi:hypothetical protein